MLDTSRHRFRSYAQLSHFIRLNYHLFETIDLSDCKCVVDGSNIFYALCAISQENPRISNEAAHANVSRNFYLSLLKSRIKPIVVISAPSTSDHALFWSRHIDRMVELWARESRKIFFEYHCRLATAEVLRELDIPFFVVENSLGDLSELARRSDACLISRNSAFFLEDIPRGFINTNWNAELLGGLKSGPVQMRVSLFKSARLLDSLKIYDELRNDLILNMMKTLLIEDGQEFLQEFVERCHSGRSNGQIRLTSDVHGPWSLRRYLVYFTLLAERFPPEALSFILGCTNQPHRPAVRQLFAFVSEHYRRKRESVQSFDSGFGESSAFEIPDPHQARASTSCLSSEDEEVVRLLRTEKYHLPLGRTPSLEAQIQNSVDEMPELSSDVAGRLSNSVESVKNPNDDQGESQALQTEARSANTLRLPQWVKDIIREEGLTGHRCAAFHWFVGVLTHESFCSLVYSHNVDDMSPYLAGLPIRRIIYGILFRGRLSERMMKNLYVKELVFIKRRRYECRVKPSWKIPLRSGSALRVPRLDEVECLDEDKRKRLFSSALTGEECWLRGRGVDNPECGYNVLLLKAWAMRSHRLRRIDVVALLISILLAEEEFDRMSHIFPWPVRVEKIPPEIQVASNACDPDLEILHAFGQLQSMADDVCNLNAALNCPFGRRVERIRLSFSEMMFYACKSFLSSLGGDGERLAFVTGLFDTWSLENFSRLVELVFCEEDRQSRQPLRLVPKCDVVQKRLIHVVDVEPFAEELEKFPRNKDM